VNNDLEALARAIQQAHGCKATHAASTPVHETFQGATVWRGTVETFTVKHPAARHCFAWSIPDPKTNDPEHVTVLAVPPVDTPKKAVQAYLVAKAKGSA